MSQGPTGHQVPEKWLPRNFTDVFSRLIVKLHLHDTGEVSQLFDSLEFEGVFPKIDELCGVPNLLTSPPHLCFHSRISELTISYVETQHLAGEDSLLRHCLLLSWTLESRDWNGLKCFFSWWEPSLATCSFDQQHWNWQGIPMSGCTEGKSQLMFRDSGNLSTQVSLSVHIFSAESYEMLATSIQMHSSLVYRVRISASALNQGTSKGVPLTVYPWYLAGVLKGFLGIIYHA